LRHSPRGDLHTDASQPRAGSARGFASLRHRGGRGPDRGVSPQSRRGPDRGRATPGRHTHHRVSRLRPRPGHPPPTPPPPVCSPPHPVPGPARADRLLADSTHGRYVV